MSCDRPGHGPQAAPCPGCGLTAADGDVNVVPPSYGASAGCWAQYGQLLARSYSSPEHRSVHQLIVDAYAVQHPGGAERAAVQLVGLCLMTLCLFVEHDVDPARGPALHKQMMAAPPDFRFLEPPVVPGPLTVADVLAAEGTRAFHLMAWSWARQMWAAWSAHHAVIRSWNAHSLPNLR